MNISRTFLLFALAAGSMYASAFTVSVDTSSLASGATGFLDIQFNGSGLSTPAGTATVTDFLGTNFAVDTGSASTFGAVTGDIVPGPLTIANTDPFNDYFVPFSISGVGSGFSFLVTLAGDILSPPPGNLSGTDFAVLLFGADGATPLLTPDGQLARIAVSASGVETAQSFPPGAVTVIPEPATASILGAALLALGLFRRGQRRI